MANIRAYLITKKKLL